MIRLKAAGLSDGVEHVCKRCGYHVCGCSPLPEDCKHPNFEALHYSKCPDCGEDAGIIYDQDEPHPATKDLSGNGRDLAPVAPAFEFRSWEWAKSVLDSNPDGDVVVTRDCWGPNPGLTRRAEGYWQQSSGEEDTHSFTSSNFINNWLVKTPVAGTAAHARVMLKSMPPGVLRAASGIIKSNGHWMELGDDGQIWLMTPTRSGAGLHSTQTDWEVYPATEAR